MAQQTFLLEVWCGNKGTKDYKWDFYRFAYKKASTVRKALIGYVEQAKDNRWKFLYPFFFADDGQYQIISTPDGYNRGEVVEQGFIKDLFN